MQRYLNGPFFLSVFKVSTRRNTGSKSASVQTCRSLILSASQYPRASTSTFTSTVTVTPTVIVNRRSKLFSSTTSFTPIKVASESADNNNNNNNPNNNNPNNSDANYILWVCGYGLISLWWYKVHSLSNSTSD